MVTLPEHGSEKAARILAAARELVLRRGVKGVTVAEVAEKARVGKGTVYLYWETREDLFVGLLARDYLAAADEFSEALTTDPDNGRPHRLAPKVIRIALEHPFVRAVQVGDADLLGVLTEHARTNELLAALGPTRLMNDVLPVWRKHRMARTDWPLDGQAYALRALLTGFIEVMANPHPLPDIVVTSPDDVVAMATTALLGPDEASQADIRATADEGLRLLDESRQAVLASIVPIGQ